MGSGESPEKLKRDETIRGNIPKDLKDWVLKKCKEGTFRSESDAVEKGLRALMDADRGKPIVRSVS